MSAGDLCSARVTAVQLAALVIQPAPRRAVDRAINCGRAVGVRQREKDKQTAKEKRKNTEMKREKQGEREEIECNGRENRRGEREDTYCRRRRADWSLQHSQSHQSPRCTLQKHKTTHNASNETRVISRNERKYSRPARLTQDHSMPDPRATDPCDSEP